MHYVVPFTTATEPIYIDPDPYGRGWIVTQGTTIVVGPVHHLTLARACADLLCGGRRAPRFLEEPRLVLA